jgi:4-hydroxybenzoate polyprenyltransferase
MKRITYFPQTFLGITFNIGCLIGYAAVKNTLSYDVFTMYIACGFWTMGYDTIYAFMDLKDDKQVGIKSTAILFEHKPFKLIIAAFYVAFLILFTFAIRDIFSIYIITAISLSIIGILCITMSLDITNEKNCMTRFKANNYIGFILFLAMLLEKL